MEPAKIDDKRLSEIITKHRHEKWGLIPLLQEIQETFGYIPPHSIDSIAAALGLFPGDVEGVIEFYSGLGTRPRGKHIFKICCGTACHVKGGRSILSAAKRELGIEEGETSADYQYTLETVACLGACFLAPTMLVDRNYYGRLSTRKISSILAHYTKEKKENQ